VKNWQMLPERSDPFLFEHKSSEINYGGPAHFHQAAFPAEDAARDFEVLVFQAVNRFTAILQAPAGTPGAGSLPNTEVAEIFFDQLGETPRLSATAFRDWYRHELAAVAEAYRRLRHNALEQEQAANVPRLNYLVSLAAVTLISALISEFYEKQIEQFGPIATHARLTLGRCLALALQGAEAEQTLRRLRQEKFGRPEPEEGCVRLINPFVLGFADNADTGLVDETLAGSNFYHLSGRLRLRLLTILGQILVKSKHFEARNLKRSLSEPASIRELLDSKPEQRRLVAVCRQEPEFRQQLVTENVLCELRRALRQAAVVSPSDELLKLVTNNRQLGELLLRPGQRSKLLKLLKANKLPQAQSVKTILDEGVRRLKRSRRRLFGRLRHHELLRELEQALGRLSEYLAQTEDFRLLRSHYGRDTNRLLDWQGLKLWRAYEIALKPRTEANGDRVRMENVWDHRKEEIENAFVEGNLFLCREEGPIYPSAHQRRIRTTFMFADLRNSTETTMKLTKDTASFLAPYLTAVDSEARRAAGERIYFAGDGYAAYYSRPTDAIRAAYQIAGRFHKLRIQSGEEHKRRAKEILQYVKDAGIDLYKAPAIRKALDTPASGSRPAEVKAFLEAVTTLSAKALTEDNLKKVLLQTALEYSMPRIDAGIAITNGELFFAMVGEEGDQKTPIVISPALTQAARLSGSSDQVKQVLEQRFPEPLPFGAYVWEQKLYNRGIVIVADLLEEVELEVELKPMVVSEEPYAQEKFLCYFDPKINKRIILRDMHESVVLKGIARACRVYEIALPFSPLDKQFGTPVDVSGR
jgi:class 3 adenylate cyclase